MAISRGIGTLSDMGLITSVSSGRKNTIQLQLASWSFGVQ